MITLGMLIHKANGSQSSPTPSSSSSEYFVSNIIFVSPPDIAIVIKIFFIIIYIIVIIMILPPRHGVCACSRGTERKAKNNGEIHCIVVNKQPLTMMSEIQNIYDSDDNGDDYDDDNRGIL